MTSLLFRLVLIDLALLSVFCTLNTTAESILFSRFFPFYLTVIILIIIQSSHYDSNKAALPTNIHSTEERK